MSRSKDNTFYIKEGDAGEILVLHLRDASGLVDLSNFTVQLKVRKPYETDLHIDAPMTLRNQTTDRGGVEYVFQAADVAEGTVGTYEAECVVTTLGGQATFPTGEPAYFQIVIQESLSPV
jgi:hypothetical protein